MAESGKVERLQGEGEKSRPKPRPLTKVRTIAIDSVESDKDNKDNSMESEVAEVHPHSKAGLESSGRLKHKRLLREVEVKTEQVKGGGRHKVHRKSPCAVPNANHLVSFSVIGALAW